MGARNWLGSQGYERAPIGLAVSLGIYEFAICEACGRKTET
jgi:hypothetical protein